MRKQVPTKIIDNKNVTKILIIKLRGIGDVVLATIILDSLHAEFPEATIDFLTEKPGREALKNIPVLNKIIIFNRKSTWQRLKLFPKIYSNKYDLVIDLFSNPATAQLTFISRANYRVGFPYKGRKYAYNYYGPSERSKYHAAQLHLEMLKQVKIPIINRKLHFEIDNNSMLFVKKWFANLGNKLNVGIIPGGGWESKRCDPIKFAEIADAIIDKYSANIILIWGPADKTEAIQIQEQMQHNAHLAPPTSIAEMAALINNCDAVVANDSGPMHISTAIGTPTLSIHGPTNPKLQGPFGDKHEYVSNDKLDCIICNLLDCPRNHECFLELPLENVINKLDLLFSKNEIHQ